MLKDIFDRMDEGKNNLISSSKIDFEDLTPEIMEALEGVIVEIYERATGVDFQSFCRLVLD
jgi:hypothetical protein